MKTHKSVETYCNNRYCLTLINGTENILYMQCDYYICKMFMISSKVMITLLTPTSGLLNSIPHHSHSTVCLVDG